MSRRGSAWRSSPLRALAKRRRGGCARWSSGRRFRRLCRGALRDEAERAFATTRCRCATSSACANSARTVVVGAAAAFGEIEAVRFEALIERARALGASGLRLTPWRAFLIAGLDRRGAESLVDSMAELGFIVDADDPRLRIAACPGAPACMHGHRSVRDDATRWAALLPKGDGVILHVSGCAKGCARPAATAATLTATATGYDLILGGRAGDPPARRGLSGAEVAQLLANEGARMFAAREAVVKPSYAYEKDAAAIYRRSFAIIRGEADLARFSPVEERVAVRVIHACGMVEAAARPRLLAGRG